MSRVVINRERSEEEEHLDDGNEVEFPRATLAIRSDAEQQLPTSGNTQPKGVADGDTNANRVGDSENGGESRNSNPQGFFSDPAQDFFAVRAGAFDTAVEACRPTILPNSDGELRGAWLLTEIDHWDNEKERLVIVTDHTLIIIKFDFITLKITEYQRYSLQQFDKMTVGELVYPHNSLVPNRNSKGVRAYWNKGGSVHFTKSWNPWSKDIPWVTFTSHPLANQRRADTDRFSVDNFTSVLVQAVEMENELRLDGEKCTVEYTPVVIENYVGIASVFHNVNNLGFFKSRGKVSF